MFTSRDRNIHTSGLSFKLGPRTVGPVTKDHTRNKHSQNKYQNSNSFKIGPSNWGTTTRVRESYQTLRISLMLQGKNANQDTIRWPVWSNYRLSAKRLSSLLLGLTPNKSFPWYIEFFLVGDGILLEDWGKEKTK